MPIFYNIIQYYFILTFYFLIIGQKIKDMIFINYNPTTKLLYYFNN